MGLIPLIPFPLLLLEPFLSRGLSVEQLAATNKQIVVVLIRLILPPLLFELSLPCGLSVEQLAVCWDGVANNQIVVVFVKAVGVLPRSPLRWVLLWARTYVRLGDNYDQRDDPQARVAFLFDLPVLLYLRSAFQTL